MPKLETADAARILKVTPATVRQLEGQGHLRAERTMSGTRLFEKADVDRLAAQRAARRNGREGR